ncbi:MAG: efflux RND transporter periplasmic adaptor subunit, partial [Oscillospiraceae bacterium]|nr:efflux RND transporter periplasmic adaptor subunit [Oscillospiraceae bacterium]
RTMKAKNILCALIAAALLTALCACQQTEVSEAPEETASETAVSVKTVARQDLATETRVSGSVMTDDSTSVYVPLSAKCTAVYKEVGDDVQKGEAICKLDLASTRSSRNAASISYNSAVESYNAQAEALDKQVALAEKAWNDAQALYEIGAASQLEIDTAELQYLSAKVQRDSTLSQLKAGIESARSSLQQLNAAMESVDSSGNVISPAGGKLSSITAAEGSYVSAGYPVAVIDGVEQMKVSVYISEALVSEIAPGDLVSVSVGAANVSFDSAIRSIDRTPNMQTKLYGVTVGIPEETIGLIDGMFADVTFRTDLSENAVVAPSEAILTNGDSQYVYIVRNGAAVYVPVTTGLIGSGVTEIKSGLSGGETIVVTGQQYLSDGTAVRIVSTEG